VAWSYGGAAQADLGIKAAYPGFIEPAFASSVDKVPDGAPDSRNQVRWLPRPGSLQNGQVKVFYPRFGDQFVAAQQPTLASIHNRDGPGWRDLRDSR
jgi:hypothetical protein